MTQARQGDVFVERVPDLDVKELVPIEPEQGRVVLVHGKATGHAHAVPATHATLYARDAERFLVVTAATELRHEEHAPVPLEIGTYRVTRQREYFPDAIRNVED